MVAVSGVETEAVAGDEAEAECGAESESVLMAKLVCKNASMFAFAVNVGSVALADYASCLLDCIALVVAVAVP